MRSPTRFRWPLVTLLMFGLTACGQTQYDRLHSGAPVTESTLVDSGVATLADVYRDEANAIPFNERCRGEVARLQPGQSLAHMYSDDPCWTTIGFLPTNWPLACETTKLSWRVKTEKPDKWGGDLLNARLGLWGAQPDNCTPPPSKCYVMRIRLGFVWPEAVKDQIIPILLSVGKDARYRGEIPVRLTPSVGPQTTESFVQVCGGRYVNVHIPRILYSQEGDRPLPVVDIVSGGRLVSANGRDFPKLHDGPFIGSACTEAPLEEDGSNVVAKTFHNGKSYAFTLLIDQRLAPCSTPPISREMLISAHS